MAKIGLQSKRQKSVGIWANMAIWNLAQPVAEGSGRTALGRMVRWEGSQPA